MSALEIETARALRVTAEPRTDWALAEVTALFGLPFNDLLYQAQWVHRQNFDPNAVQVSTLLSIKTGACPEDCSYCPQSIRFETGVERHDLMPLEEVREAARRAKEAGATRFCMGASYRGPKDSQLEPILDMIKEVKALGLETCATLGLLRPGQAERLADAGLDYYNHNIDSSPEFYGKIITTRTFADRLETLERVRAAGVKVCCGGIVGMGETREDRVGFLHALATLTPHPESVPINELVPVPGTPLAAAGPLDPFEFVRSIAVARILMPRSHVRLSAGRSDFSDELQALCFFAGANSVFYGRAADHRQSRHGRRPAPVRAPRPRSRARPRRRQLVLDGERYRLSAHRWLVSAGVGAAHAAQGRRESVPGGCVGAIHAPTPGRHAQPDAAPGHDSSQLLQRVPEAANAAACAAANERCRNTSTRFRAGLRGSRGARRQDVAAAASMDGFTAVPRGPSQARPKAPQKAHLLAALQ
jgi:biotin synthase